MFFLPAISLVSSSAGGSFSPATIAAYNQYFERVMTLPSAAVQADMLTFIDTLVTAGIWDRLDGLYILASWALDASYVNLIQAAYEMHIDVPTAGSFTALNGWNTTNEPSSLKPTGYTLTTAGNKYLQDDAELGVWSFTDAAGLPNNWYGLQDSSAATVRLFMQRGDTHLPELGMNGGGYADPSPQLAHTNGLWVLQRSSNASIRLLVNNNVINTSAFTSVALSAETLAFGNAGIGATVNTAAAFFGGSLTDPQNTTLFNALTTLFAAIGAA